MVRRSSVVFILAAVTIIFIFMLNFTHPGFNITTLPRRYLETVEICSVPKTNIFFLKTHKCGSSTVQNILMRYGLKNGCTFVLPESQNYIGNPKLFTPELIGRKVRTPDGKYNIFTHHTRLNTSAVRSVMYDDAMWVTIMRDPVELFESLYSYYALDNYYKTTLRHIIKNPSVAVNSLPRFASKIGPNQMSWDLGMSVWQFKYNTSIKNLIQKVELNFDLVMIAEYMEASLILLKDLMCWSVDDVVFFMLNARPDTVRTNLTDYERQKVAEINSADIELYNYFLNKFRIRVKEFGEDRMMKEVEELLERNAELYEQCVKNKLQPYDPSGPYNNMHYELWENSGSLQHLCRTITMTELHFTDAIREKQAAKISKLQKLQELISTWPNNNFGPVSKR